MNFHDYLYQQLNLHPSMQPQDIIKMCYQAAKGTEHLLSDIEAAHKYFENEYSNAVQNNNVPLYEEISPDVCRVNLRAWKSSGMPSEWLFRMFVHSASITFDGETLLEKYLISADKFVKTEQVPFTYEQWQNYIAQYKGNGMPSVHHSQKYGEAENPAYRIVHKRFIKLIPILQQAEVLNHDKTNAQSAKTTLKNTVCIAIDGRAASGKSTMADDLKAILNSEIIHIDDFFLPPALRTEARLKEIGGNVHYERFAEEVLPLLTGQTAFTYRTFDCSKMDYGTERFVNESEWRIVEGAYSHHPYFGAYADIKVFSDISPKMQMSRIHKRNGKQMAERFAKEWIPMEEKYYDYYQIKENADIVISN